MKKVFLRPKIRLSDRLAITNSKKQDFEFPSEAMIRKFGYGLPHLAGIENWADGEGTSFNFILSDG